MKENEMNFKNDEISKELLVELEEHSVMAGFNTWNTTATSSTIAVSHFVGNKGRVCTYSVECVNNCR
ncbi:plantaricin C family lantibiotic [Staphylococcus haemolyticus]|uniref:plantaricin C family lantibiotic n=1 Tax=Staphylococcus haemolyticus TaxID=1283 RepID=UPI0021B2166D|nr:plantaricin C family lantibiotic [Staphylococcus haemolyticus]